MRFVKCTILSDTLYSVLVPYVRYLFPFPCLAYARQPHRDRFFFPLYSNTVSYETRFDAASSERARVI